MLRLLQGDVGSGKTAVAAYALAAAARAGFQGALLAPTDLLARQHLDTVGGAARRPRRRRPAAGRLAQGRASGRARCEPIASGPGVGRRRDARAVPGVGRRSRGSASRSSTSSIASASSSAASSRPRPAARRAARPAHDRDADPADARPGPVRRPRRVRPAHAAGRPHPDPDRHPPPGRPRRRPGSKVREEAAAGHRTFVVVPLIEEGTDGVDDGGALERGRRRDRGGPADRAAWPRCGSGSSTAG